MLTAIRIFFFFFWIQLSSKYIVHLLVVCCKYGPLFSSSMGYPILEDFEESARETTLRFNIINCSAYGVHFQLNEADSYNQCILARSDFPTVFSREQTPSTSATQIASTSRVLKAASLLSPLPSVSRHK